MGPSITDANDISTLLKTVGSEGALTPNTVIGITNKLFDLKIESVKDAWGDYPYSMIRDYISRGVVMKGVSEFMDTVDCAISVLGKEPRGGANNVNNPSTAPVTVSANPSEKTTVDATQSQENEKNSNETLDKTNSSDIKYEVVDMIQTLNKDLREAEKVNSEQ